MKQALVSIIITNIITVIVMVDIINDVVIDRSNGSRGRAFLSP